MGNFGKTVIREGFKFTCCALFHLLKFRNLNLIGYKVIITILFKTSMNNLIFLFIHVYFCSLSSLVPNCYHSPYFFAKIV